jgi:hypothetical protein
MDAVYLLLTGTIPRIETNSSVDRRSLSKNGTF